MIDSRGKPRPFADPERVEFPIRAAGAQSLVDVRVPGAFGQCCRTIKCLAIIAHQIQQPRRPEIIKLRRDGETSRVLIVIADINDIGNSNLSQIVDAGGLLAAPFGA